MMELTKRWESRPSQTPPQSLTKNRTKLLKIVKAETPPQATALWLACRLKAWDSALLLLSRGADPNKGARDSNGYVLTGPLQWAAFRNSTARDAVIRSLLASGARLDKGEQHLILCFSLASSDTIAVLLFAHYNHHLSSLSRSSFDTRTPGVHSRNYWVSVIKNQTKPPLEDFMVHPPF